MAKKNKTHKQTEKPEALVPPDASESVRAISELKKKDQSNKVLKRNKVPFYKNKFILIFAAVSLLRLWLTSDLKLIAIPSTTDDYHYVLIAAFIKAGRWLGSLNQLTLHTRTFFPLYLAYLSGLKIPLLFANQVLYIASVGFAFFTLRKFIKNDWIILSAYAFVLFNPMFYAGDMNRVVREGMWVPLALFIVFGLVQCFFIQEKFKWQIVNSVLCGLAMGAFYLTREDGLMIFPVAGFLCLAFVVLKFKEIKTNILKSIGLMAIPFIIVKLLVVWNIQINYNKYKANFTYEGEMKSNTAFFNLLSTLEKDTALIRLGIPYSKDTRMKLYQYVPTFAQLKKQEFYFLAWSEREGIAKGELRHFGHAVKWALNAGGFYENYKKVDEFYINAKADLQKAIDEGHFKQKETNPGGGSEYLNYIKNINLGTMLYGLNFTINLNDFKQFDTHEFGDTTYGDVSTINDFKNITNNKLAFTQKEATPQNREAQAHEVKNVLMKLNYDIYEIVVKYLFYISLLCFVASFYFSFREKNFFVVAVLLTCALFMILRIFILASFYETNNLFSIKYLAPVYPFLFLFIGVSIGTVVDFYLRTKKRKIEYPS